MDNFELENEPESREIEFEIPEIGLRALEKLNEADAELPDEEEKKSGDIPVASADEMAKILDMQAAKVHERPPVRPDDFKSPAQGGGKMIIGLSGIYSSGGAPAKDEKRGDLIPREFKDALEFLDESIGEYEKYVNNISRNGLAAVNVGYYRDDIQDMLDMLKYEKEVNLRPYWERIVRIDMRLRQMAPVYVKEVGYENFKQYQIINDPPLTSWWWYLNQKVSPPIKDEPKFWEVWKKI